MITYKNFKELSEKLENNAHIINYVSEQIDEKKFRNFMNKIKEQIPKKGENRKLYIEIFCNERISKCMMLHMDFLENLTHKNVEFIIKEN